MRGMACSRGGWSAQANLTAVAAKMPQPPQARIGHFPTNASSSTHTIRSVVAFARACL